MPVSDASRRTFLIAGSTTAAVAGVVAAGVTAPAMARTHSKPVSTPANALPLVAHIADPSSGVLSVLVGEREVVLHDPDLVGRIVRAADAG
jgi:hypothetical protein